MIKIRVNSINNEVVFLYYLLCIHITQSIPSEWKGYELKIFLLFLRLNLNKNRQNLLAIIKTKKKKKYL